MLQQDLQAVVVVLVDRLVCRRLAGLEGGCEGRVGCSPVVGELGPWGGLGSGPRGCWDGGVSI